MPAAIIYDNLADAATVSASSWIAAAPPSTLQNHHVRRRWKGRLGDTEHILVDLGEPTSIDTVALLGCQYVDANDNQTNMTAAAVTRIRVSEADPTGEDGSAYDSGAAAGRISDKYAALVKHIAGPVSGRYVRIDLSQASATALLAGRLVIGLRNTFTINFGYGWGYGYQDLSRRSRSRGGQDYVERDERRRVLTLTFESLDEDDRYSFVLEADRLNGISRDVLFVIDPESVDPARDCVWGLMTDLSPPVQPNIAFFSKSYSIEERL